MGHVLCAPEIELSIFICGFLLLYIEFDILSTKQLVIGANLFLYHISIYIWSSKNLSPFFKMVFENWNH